MKKRTTTKRTRKSAGSSKSRKTARRRDELTLLYEVSTAVTSTLDPDKVMDLVTKSACEITGAKASTLRLLNRERNELDLAASFGVDMEGSKKKPIRVGQSIAGLAVKTRRSQTVTDVHKDKRYISGAYAKKAGLKSLLSVPMVMDGKSIGVLSVYTTRKHKFSRREVKILTLFAAQAAVAIQNAELFAKTERSYTATIKALGALIDSFDWHTKKHSEMVRDYAVKIAEEMDLDREEIAGIEYAAYIHDVGKIGIDMNILRKPGALTAEEWIHVTKHPILGAEIVGRFKTLEELAPLVRHHHEKYAGHGYPDGLKGEAIPLGARILAVADAYDAMTSDRPYRSAMSKQVALQELKRMSGTQFDPVVVRAFEKILKLEEEVA